MTINIVVRHVAGPYDGVLGVQKCVRCGWVMIDSARLFDMTAHPLTPSDLGTPIGPYAMGRPVAILYGTDPTRALTLDCVPVRAPSRRYLCGETTAYT